MSKSTVQSAIDAALADGTAKAVGVNAAALGGPSASVAEACGISQSEYEFQEEVVAFARLHGWKVVGVRPVRVQRKDGSVYYQTPFFADGVGWPDLTLVKGGEILFVECKTLKGVVSPEQSDWLDALQATGAAAGILTRKSGPRFRRNYDHDAHL